MAGPIARLRLVPPVPSRGSVHEAAPKTAAPPAPKPALDDAEILARVRRGDASAATALYRRARPRIAATIARFVGNADPEKEDLVQMSLVELVRSIANFRGECSFDTWTARVTARTVFRALRKRSTERGLVDRTVIADGRAREYGDTASVVLSRSALERVRHHLEEMDHVKAWTVLLHDVCGYDLREIAEITDVSITAAQTRLSRGRIDLHERLEADPELVAELERGRR